MEIMKETNLEFKHFDIFTDEDVRQVGMNGEHFFVFFIIDIIFIKFS